MRRHHALPPFSFCPDLPAPNAGADRRRVRRRRPRGNVGRRAALPGSGGAVRGTAAPFPRKSAKRDLPVHGRRRIPPRYLRPQAAAGKGKRAALQDESRADAIQQQRQHARQPVEVQPVWPERHPRKRPLSTRRPVRGQPFDHPLDDVRLLRARRRQLLPSHRHRPAGQAEHGLVGGLRPGKHRPGPAGIHRAQQRQDADRRAGQLQQRLPAGHLPGARSSAAARAPWPTSPRWNPAPRSSSTS